MPRMSRLFLAAALSTLAALLPVTAFASTSPLIVAVVGAQYAFGVGVPPCTASTSSSFAGYARPNGVFSTTICHGSLASGGVAAINDGGIFQLVTSRRILVGRYKSGSVGPGVPSHLYPGSTLCKEVFGVTADLGPAGTVPAGATNIKDRSSASGTLTHFGVFDGPACTAKAATITGIATLYY
jgi:hypothetical protein